MEENKMKVVVLCFGNEFVDFDKLPLTLCKELKNKIPGVDFVSCESPNEILDYSGYDKIFILDVVKGIKDVSIIEDLDMLKERKLFTLHDFDLGLFLKILNEVMKIKNLKIIGIPFGYDKNKAKMEIKKIISRI